MFTFLALKLHTNDPTSVDKAIADKVQQAPGFFANTPVVVDFSVIEQEPETNGAALLQIVREHKLIPVVASIRDKDCALAQQLDIPLVEAGSRKSSAKKASSAEKPKAQAGKETPSLMQRATANTADPDDSLDEPLDDSWDDSWNENHGQNNAVSAKADARTGDETSDATAEVANAAAMSGSEVEYVIKSPKLVNRPVRSGQQVYARDTDLVILGSIGPGAEIIADSNIHVYGALRGRALCGVAGNTEARIFCQSLEAELVSVAGNYKVLEEIPEELRGKPAQIWFGNDKLMIEPL